MNEQQQLADQFRSLHVKGRPVILYNIWDVGTAKAVVAAGAKALATGSAPVAMANGFGDGEKVPFDMALENITRIVTAVYLPVSLDIEGAYSIDPEQGGANLVRAIRAGAIGFNFEDQIVGGEGLHATADQAVRLKVARKACDATGVNAFINARTDIFLKAKLAGEPATKEMLEQAIERAEAYADAGADGFFAPGLLDIDMISELCAKASLPVNIIALPGAPENPELAQAGVARISYGPVPYRKMIAWFEEQARLALGG